MTKLKTITMDSAVCPACAVEIPKRNVGCPHCQYTFAGCRVGTLREALESQTEFNNVSPAFLRVLVQAAQAA